MDEDFVERRPGDVEMYRRLDAFAQVRLAPDAAAMARIRTALMGEAVAMADARAATMTLSLQAPAVLPDRPSLTFQRPQVSRWSAAFLAACLSVGLAAGSVAASAAGGPFYGPRLWLEEATLPSAPLAHAHGQLERLDARLEEIGVATSNGNAGAAEAALIAYAEIVEDLETQALGNPAVAADVLDDVARRQVVLMALLGMVPPQAQDALEHALQQGANAVEAIGDDDGNLGDPVRRGWGIPGTNQGGGQGSGSQGGSDNGTDTGSGSGSGSGSGGRARVPGPARVVRAIKARPGTVRTATASPTTHRVRVVNARRGPTSQPSPRRLPRSRRKARPHSNNPIRVAVASRAAADRAGRTRATETRGTPTEPRSACAATRRVTAPARYSSPMRARSNGIEITVIGAGPAYTDRAGAVGASYLVTHGDTKLVMDLGQGTFARLAGTVEPSTLDAIVVSHLHPDHFVDLVPMRHYMRWEFQPPRRSRIIGPRDLPKRLDALHADDGFSAQAFDTEALSETTFEVGSLTIAARRVHHIPDSFAFRVSAGEDAPGLVYTGDCGRATDIDPLVCPGDTLLSEVSFGPGPGDPGAAHLDGPSVGALAARTGVRRVLLTHLGMHLDRDETIASVRSQFRGGAVDLVEPGLETAVD